MSNIDRIVDDIFHQLDLYTNLNKKAFLSVYIAKHNLHLVQDTLIQRASVTHNVYFQNISTYLEFVSKVLGHELNIWQKPDPYPEPSNHLLLTVGGLTAIIFDYEENTYV